MAAEELTGRPTPGLPADRIDALTKRIAYLERQKASFLQQESQDGLDAITRDLAEARRQLLEWQHQNENRN